ncbi:MAG: restriction endonuclease subunit S [Bacteroidales bacterium]|nr:restriction endonuclease subunit S [Bacteroidales bacterium]
MNNTYFSLSNNINKSKVFILNLRELEKRLDPFYYIPELLELERKVLAKNPKKLRDYVKSISSGATPKTTESDKYYSDSENGIPFLRVQNITEWGLDLYDVKFINKETHNIALRRSQVFENDLLVTITGRIASSAVAPKDFEGNINQHSVVIKTETKEISEILACYLNSSIGQQLALRLTTGGTRPALDYSALLSIPVIYDKRILVITQKVVEQKKQNEAEAEKLLASIDDYLLNELGITLPTPPENTLKNRMFFSSIKDISGKRFDPFYHQKYFTLLINNLYSGKYEVKKLENSLIISVKLEDISKYKFINYIDLSSIEKKFGIIYNENIKTIEFPEFPSRARQYIENGDLLISGLSGSLKSIAIIDNKMDNLIASTGFFVIKKNIDKYNNRYIFALLRTSLYQALLGKLASGAIMASINYKDLCKLPIPFPPLNKQKEIADHITNIRRQAQLLKDKTKTVLEEASKEIEAILLK